MSLAQLAFTMCYIFQLITVRYMVRILVADPSVAQPEIMNGA